ncbi:MAG: cytochrome c oxidase subunit II [candidate division NC10 bacterium]|nr:cytochrome c oxidase subunit II [candidate division NC10 bacterium]MCH7896114.1 cytochrome c oxidase subunit II [candidate division NC10 bacterium]MCZ6550415.1 cytochrome c oxidase subunit II [candidate division NC10 bacterium]
MLEYLKLETWLPENVSTYGAEIDFLFYVIYYITGVAFILVAAAMVAFLIIFRHREGRRARYVHGNTVLEIVWTVGTALIVIVLGIMSEPLWARIKQQVPPSDIQVRVTGKQFNWEILYPGPDGKFETADDVQMDNELHVPVNRVVQVFLTSKDVIHSFFLPNLRLKQDALPGRTIQAWFEATKPGVYEIPCAELCGFGHSGMLGYLTVHSAKDYEKWVKEQWPQS